MSAISLFEEKQVRRAWNAAEEKWVFAIVDVLAILTDSPNPQIFWRVLKKRLLDEGNETVTNCNGLKMTAADGKHPKGLNYGRRGIPISCTERPRLQVVS